MEEIIIGFNRVGREVSQALKLESTGFVLVSAPYNNAVRSAHHLVNELKSHSYPLIAMIMNRNLPFALQDSVARWQSRTEALSPLAPGFDILQKRQSYASSLGEQLTQHAVAVLGQPVNTFLLEEQTQMIHSEAALWKFVEALCQAKIRTT